MEAHKLKQFAISSNAVTTFESWEKWKRSLEFAIGAKGITDHIRKKAILLHRGGPELQEVFASLEKVYIKEAIEAKDHYAFALNVLDRHFKPTVNKAYERYRFRLIRQNEDSIEQFVIRLRRQAENCDFDQVEREIADQVIFGTSNSDFRTKILEKRLESLDAIIELGKLLDSVSVQSQQLAEGGISVVGKSSVGADSSSDSVARVAPSKEAPLKKQADRGRRCGKCGSRRHSSNAENCPALNRSCYKCEQKGHFSNCCPEVRSVTDDRNASSSAKQQPKSKANEKERRDNVKLVKPAPVSESDSSDESDCSFAIHDASVLPNQLEENRVVIRVGGIPVPVYVDSMASRALFDASVWADLRRRGVKFEPAEVTRNLFPYGKSKPLAVKKAVYLNFESASAAVRAKAYILDKSEGNCESILGSRVAKLLKVLQVGESDNASSRKPKQDDAIRRVAESAAQQNAIKTGKLRNFQLIIPEDKSVPPVAQSCRRIPFAVRKPLRERCKKMLDADIIERVYGAARWVSNVVPVLKRNGDLRVCVDMRRANAAVLREQFQIPTFDEIVSDLHGACIYSKVDLDNAYHQVELDPRSREITTFVTPDGLYRFKRLFFGVKCAPEIFQRIMADLLRDLPQVRVFFDDIIIFSKTKAEHELHVKQVIDRLTENGLTINMKKSIFGASQIEFLGHRISKNSVEPSESNVAAVMNFETPSSKKDLQSFLGLINYVARFIPHFSTVTAPLRVLLKKNAVFRWGSAQKHAFKALKESVASMKTAIFNPEANTQLLTDASPVGLGAVLLQQSKPGEPPEIVAFASHSLTPAERNYSQIEREALGLVWGCERFKMYLLGRRFELLTDHKPLEMLFGPKSRPNARLERWIMRLQCFDYKIRHIPGSSNIADPFSRLLQARPGTKPCARQVDQVVCRIAEAAVPKRFDLETIQTASRADPEISAVLEALGNGSAVPAPFVRMQYELTDCDGVLLRGDRIVPPESLRNAILRQAHEGHPGGEVMKRRLRSKVWWPRIDAAVDKFVKSCLSCTLVSSPEAPPPMNRTALPAHEWEYVAIDYMGPLPSGESVLVVVDYFSRFVEVAFTKSVSAAETIKLLWQIFSRHGFPSRLKSDNAQAFLSEEFKGFLDEFGITHITSPPLWPQANGEVERQNRSLLKRLKIAAAEGKALEIEACKFVLLQNSTPHSTTGKSPAQLLFHRQLRDKLPSITHTSVQRDTIADKDAEAKARGKEIADKSRRAKPSTIRVGDEVLLKAKKTGKLSPTFAPEPFRVTSVNAGELTVQRGTKTFRRSLADVRKYPVAGSGTAIQAESDSPYAAAAAQVPLASGTLTAAQGDRHQQSSEPEVDESAVSSPSADPAPTPVLQSPGTLPTAPSSPSTPYVTRSGRAIHKPARFQD